MKRRAGFTLVELLVVITILLILSTFVWAVFRTNSSDKMRSAARIAQSAFLGAKDRALHAKDLRGVRLIRDTTNPNLVTGFAYLQPLPLLTYGQSGVTPGVFQLERLDLIPPPNGDGVADSPDIVIVHGFDQTNSANGTLPTPAPSAFVDWSSLTQLFVSTSKIRIPSQTGQWYQFTFQTSGPYALGPGKEYLQLVSPFVGGAGNPFSAVVAFDCSSAFSSCDISLGNDVLPFHQPIPLSSSCVIDLPNSGGAVPTLVSLASGGSIDVMFSPRGNVSGPLQGLGPLHFLLRDLKDATAGFNPFAVGPAGSTNPDLNTGDRLILSVMPQTGLVQVFELDTTDLLTNGTSAGPPDGLADNPFNFARTGQSAGR